MPRLLALASLCFGLLAFAAEEPAKGPLVSGLKDARAVCVGPGGKIYVATKEAVLVVENGQAKPFAAGFKDVKGLAAFQQWLYVCEKLQVQRFDAAGKASVVLPPEPARQRLLTAITANQETGQVFVADAGIGVGAGHRLFRLSAQGQATVVTDSKRCPAYLEPTALLCDGASHILFLTGDGELHRLRLSDFSAERLLPGMASGEGLCWDHFGRLYLIDLKTDGQPASRIVAIRRPGEKPVSCCKPMGWLVGLCLAPGGKALLTLDRHAESLIWIPLNAATLEVDERPLPLKPAIAFPNLKWEGWKAEDAKGRPYPLRSIMLTHAGDGSNRVFVGVQQGVVHVFPNDQAAAATQVFLDIQDRVQYSDATNEEGFLGLAFHPRFKENGEFFVFYTTKKDKLTNIVSRFRVRKDDPNRADPASEEELLRFKKPFWNHDGGTLCFGPDGYLYLTHGDGGLANDPYNNGQNLKSLLGKVLRIDVDKKDEGKAYAVPKDNPFVSRSDVLPEIWAYGLRNIWRMAFDKKTGQLWAADVGQNLWEEIDLIEKGGNYGWNLHEGLHPFGLKGCGPRPDLIDPIWEYHHDVGKSITGGLVYRGKRLPELDGAYLYADYVSGRIWALRYDPKLKRVTENRPILDTGMPIFSFGEDEQGEAYLLTATPTGQGIYWLAKP